MYCSNLAQLAHPGKVSVSECVQGNKKSLSRRVTRGPLCCTPKKNGGKGGSHSRHITKAEWQRESRTKGQVIRISGDFLLETQNVTRNVTRATELTAILGWGEERLHNKNYFHYLQLQLLLITCGTSTKSSPSFNL